MKYLFMLALILSQSVAFAARPISFSGRVLRSDDTAIENQYTKFNVKIENASDCVLLEEEFDMDMQNSNGYFKLTVGTQAIGPLNPNGIDIFKAGTYACQNGTSWIAPQGAIRKVTMSVKVDSDPWVVFSSDVMNSMAYAQDAEYLQGKKPSDFIQVNSATDQAKIDAIALKKDSLVQLAEGTSNLYTQTGTFTSVLAAKQDLLGFTPLRPGNNLSDLPNIQVARGNLGLRELSIKSKVGNDDITDLSWLKLTAIPTTFPSSAHTHPVSNVVGLEEILNSKMNKVDFTCINGQTLSYNSVLDTFSCSAINIGGDIIGTLADSKVSKIKGIEVDLSDLQDKMVLQYDQVSNKWKPISISAGNIPKVYAGQIFEWPTSNCPVGSIAADGQKVSKTAYPDLFDVLSNVYGANEQVANNDILFFLPDYRGVFRRGLDNGRGQDPGRTITQFQNEEFKSHTHIQNAHQHVSNVGQVESGSYDIPFGANTEGNAGRYANSGYGYTTLPWVKEATATNKVTGGAETRPKNAAVRVCMRYQNVY